MSHRTRRCALPLVVSLFLTFFVTVAGPAHAFVDRDCGDFSSQRAAQIFYLKAGGPQQDPHGLDADDDGVACDSNPCPCYYGTQPPGDNPPATPPAPVKSSVTLKASRSSGITGEKVRMVATVKPNFSRSIVLQRKAGNRWVREDAGKTRNDGKWLLKGSVARKTTTYRAVVPATKRNGKKYTAATSGRVTIKALEQQVSLQLSDRSVVQGERLVATVTAKPVRAGRPVTLQRRANGGWASVGTDKQSRTGKARFVFDAASEGTFDYRAVVKRYRGAVPFRSATRDLDVAPPPDTTPPGVPSGLVATAGDRTVTLDWSDVSATDLRGYRVYYSVAGGPRTQLTTQPVTTSSYTASSLTNGTQYTFCVTAVDQKGNASSCSASASATPGDTTAPAAPQGLTAVAGDGAVDLDWEDVTAPDLSVYRVYVATSAEGPWTMVTGALTTSAYRAEGLGNGTQYFYKVSAVDSSGNESASSVVVSGTPTAPAAEPAPAG